MKDKKLVVKFPLEELAKNAKQSQKDIDSKIPNNIMIIEGESESLKASLFIKNITGALNGAKIDVKSVQSILLLK